MKNVTKNWVRIANLIIALGLPFAMGLDKDFDSRDSVDYFDFRAEPSPLIPPRLLQSGFTAGKMRIIVEVASTGVLRDYLVLESTHKELIPELRKVIDRWIFYPPIRGGERASGINEIVLKLRAPERPVTLDATSAHANFLETVVAIKPQDYKIASWQDLDNLPEPSHIVSPYVPEDLLKERHGSRVTFKFYIDQWGSVRCPHVWKLDEDIDDRALLAVQEALRQWRLKPLTAKGNPVALEVTQVFDLK